jgi:hypothetical protein
MCLQSRLCPPGVPHTLARPQSYRRSTKAVRPRPSRRVRWKPDVSHAQDRERQFRVSPVQSNKRKRPQAELATETEAPILCDLRTLPAVDQSSASDCRSTTSSVPQKRGQTSAKSCLMLWLLCIPLHRLCKRQRCSCQRRSRGLRIVMPEFPRTR